MKIRLQKKKYCIKSSHVQKWSFISNCPHGDSVLNFFIAVFDGNIYLTNEIIGGKKKLILKTNKKHHCIDTIDIIKHNIIDEGTTNKLLWFKRICINETKFIGYSDK